MGGDGIHSPPPSKVTGDPILPLKKTKEGRRPNDIGGSTAAVVFFVAGPSRHLERSGLNILQVDLTFLILKNRWVCLPAVFFL